MEQLWGTVLEDHLKLPRASWTVRCPPHWHALIRRPALIQAERRACAQGLHVLLVIPDGLDRSEASELMDLLLLRMSFRSVMLQQVREPPNTRGDHVGR